MNFLILVTTLAGFYLASKPSFGGFRSLLAVHMLLGRLLVAGGTGTLNQFIERTFDAQMRRTARRPLTSGRLKASHVLYFGISLSLVGTVYLALAVNVLTFSLAALILGLIFLYYSARFAFHRSNVAARRLLAASIIYLPAVFILMMLNKK